MIPTDHQSTLKEYPEPGNTADSSNSGAMYGLVPAIPHNLESVKRKKNEKLLDCL